MSESRSRTPPAPNLDAIKEWDEQQFDDALIHEIHACNAERVVISTFRSLGNTHGSDWFPRNGRRPARSLARADFRTIARICMVLDTQGHPISLDELRVPGRQPGGTVFERLMSIDREIKSANALKLVIDRSLNEFNAQFLDSITDALSGEVASIAAGKTSLKQGHILDSEVRAIADRCSHIRVMTTRIDFGVRWDNETGVPQRRKDFRIFADRMRDIRHTFIVPGTTGDELELQPSPFAGSKSPSWEERADLFLKLYHEQGYISMERLRENVVFRHTPLPIPAGSALFAMSEDGYEHFKSERPELYRKLSSDRHTYIHETPDGGAFFGIAIGGSEAPDFAVLMNRRAILYASQAFIRYWSSLEASDRDGLGFDPRVGVPTGLDTQFETGQG